MNYYFSNQYSDELYHYGVKGMKWGVRKAVDRYYDTDGRRFDRRTEKTIKRARRRGATSESISRYRKARASERITYIRNSKAARKVDSTMGREGTSTFLKTQNTLVKKSKGTRTAKKAMMRSGKAKASQVTSSKSHKKGAQIALQYGLIGYAVNKKKGNI